MAIDEKTCRYIPKELSTSTGKIRSIDPPKGRISSKAAYRLEHSISVQIRANALQSQKSLAYVERKEYSL